MKRKNWLFCVIFSLFAIVSSFSQSNTVSINDALKEAALQFSTSLRNGTTVAILGISSQSEDLSEYMLDELTTNVVQVRKLQVVTRANLDIIKKEMDFQLTGEVSDETMQQLGAKTGAQTVISGTFKQLGTTYRLNIQAFNVTTAAIQDVYRTRVSDDETLALLMKKKVVNARGEVVKSAYDYTTGERVGMGFQNMLFGLGSYTHGHWGDGLFMTVVEGFGLYCFIYGNIGDEKTSTDGYGNEKRKTTYNAGMVGTGFCLIGASWLYGFIRPCFYHKQAKLGMDGKYDGLNIALAPAQDGIVSQVSYKISW